MVPLKQVTPNAQKVKEDAARVVEEEIIDYYLEIDDEGKFLHPPSTDDELWEFVAYAFRVKVPRKAIEPHHKSPFSFIADLFFERVKNALGFANRNGGKTLNVAVLNMLDMLFKPGCEVASAGAVLDQASKCYRYFCSFQKYAWFTRFCENYKAKTKKDFISKCIQSWTKFATDSVMEILTGTEKGLRSPHPHKARLDEIDLMTWDLIQTGFSMARSSEVNGVTIRGQNVFTSTRQYQHGVMQRLLDEADAKGIAVYEWNVWEILEKCNRRCINDPEYGSCPIYKFCKGKAHHCEGYYSIDDFIDKVRAIDRETLDVEWLNLRPSRHKLVYHRFDNTKHILNPDKLAQLTGFSYVHPTWYRIAGVDFGSSPGHPFVYLKVAEIPNGVGWLAFYEYVAEQRLMRDHAENIKRSPHFMGGEKIYADWNAQDRLELKSHGIRTKQAVKDVNMGINYINELLSGYLPSETPKLYIWHSCTNLIQEFGTYSWPSHAGRVDRSGTPLKGNDHCLDALRYALYSDRSVPRFKYRFRNIPGV